MILLGLLLLICGLLFGIGVLTTIGVVLMVLGAVFFVAGSLADRPIGGRRHWW